MLFKKYEGNPILKPNPANDWESLCVQYIGLATCEFDKFLKYIVEECKVDE